MGARPDKPQTRERSTQGLGQWKAETFQDQPFEDNLESTVSTLLAAMQGTLLKIEFGSDFSGARLAGGVGPGDRLPAAGQS